MRPTRWIALALLSAWASSAGAEEGTAPSDTLRTTVPGIEVTALRGRERLKDVPAATFVLTRDDLRRSGVARLSTLLQATPGLYGYGQTSNGDPTTIDPRGFTASGESSYLKLLVNGQDVRDLENGDVDWDWVLPDDVERVEVVQGSGSWLYGDASEGGIVNVVRPEPPVGFGSDCSLRIGSFGLRTASLMVSEMKGPSSGSLRGSLREVDGWRFRSRERVYGAGGEARRGFGGRELSIDVSYLDADRQNPGSLTADQLAANRDQAETTHDFDHAKRGLLSIRFQAAPGREPAWSFAPYLRGEDTDQIRTLIEQPLFHHTRGWTGGAELEYRGRTTLGGRPLAVLSTVQGEHALLESEYSAFDPTQGVGDQVASGDSWRTSGSASAGARLEIDPRTVARLSVRVDAARVHDEDNVAGTASSARTLTAVSPLLALSHQVGSQGSVYASASTGFRVPTLYQLYDRRPFELAPGFSITLSNEDLDPQRSTSVELGGRIDTPAGGSAMLAVYSSWVRDEIDFDLASLSYANISESWHRGVEAQASWPLARSLTAVVAGAWTPTTFRGERADPTTEGKQINGVPLGTGYASLAWTPVPDLSVETGARMVGRQFLDKSEQNPLASFAAWELGVSGRLQRLRGAFRVLNLFDQPYSDSGFIDALGQERFLPAAPRSVSFSVTLD